MTKIDKFAPNMKLKNIRLYIVVLLTTVFCYFYSFFEISPELIKHSQQIAFQFDYQFFVGFTNYSGGIAEYVALFISQFFYSDTIGSLIIALSGLLLSVLLYQILKQKWNKVKLSFLIIPLPQIIQLALQADYKYPFSISLNLLLLFSFSFFALHIAKRQWVSIYLIILVLGAMLYYISGGIYFLVFMSAMLLLNLKTSENKIITIVFHIVIAGLLPYLFYRFLLFDSFYNAYLKSIPDVAKLIIYRIPGLFYLHLNFLLISIALMYTLSLPVFTKKKPDQIEKPTKLKQAKSKKQKKQVGQRNIKKQKTKSRNNAPKLKFGLPYISILVQIIILVFASYILISSNEHIIDKYRNQIDYYAYNQEWDKVIRLGKEAPKYDRMINFQYNRAIAHNGNLLDSLFTYEQLAGARGLFIDNPFAGEITIPASDLYLDLGNINEALHYAFEAQTLIFYSPRVLKRIIDCSIIKRNFRVASEFLNIISNNKLENKWVMQYKNYIQDTALVNKVEWINDKRLNLSENDTLSFHPRDKMINILNQNPENKMAFEYLIAFTLLEQDMKGFLKGLTYIKNFKYKKIPSVIEQAIILSATTNPDLKYLRKIKISAKVKQQFKEFSLIMKKYKQNNEAKRNAMQKFKNTYWYYILFLSPRVTKNKVILEPVNYM